MSFAKTIIASLVALAIGVYFRQTCPSEQEIGDRIFGKRVVVTGASFGIGRDIAKEYAERGAAEIVLVARSQHRLEVLRREILWISKEQSDTASSVMVPLRVHVIPADLSSEETCKEVVASAVTLMGSIDYFVLNHITNSQYGLWTEKNDHDFVTNFMAVNTLSYIWLTTEALPFLEQRSGQILVISSFAGWVGVPHTALYSSSKHALRGFFNALRVELSLYQNSTVGVTICTIGATDTEATKSFQERISGVKWEDPRVVAGAIVASGATRERELFYPPLITYPSIVLHFVAPRLMEKLLQMTMH